MRRKKISLILIIVFLVIFSPLAVLGFIHKNNQNMLDENPGHDRYFKGYIWFYDDNDNYLSKYECQTETCKLSGLTIDDEKYGINYYKEGTQDDVGIINNHYTFITDGVFNYLYDITTGTSLQKYKAIKTYNTTIEGNYYIVQNENNLWGVLTINNMLTAVLPFEYDFIGLKSELNNNNNLVSEKFIVSKDSKWYLVDENNSAITGETTDPIVDYINEIMFTKANGKVRIFDFNENEFLAQLNIKDFISLSNCTGVILDNNYLNIYKNLYYAPVKQIYLSDPDNVTMENNGYNITVKIGENVIDTVELN